MSKKPLACRHCGRMYQRTAGAGLFCGDDCESGHAEAIANTRKTLEANGFVQHPEVSNVWTKDGVAVTEDHVKIAGLELSMRRHSSAVAEHNAGTF